ncbi:hypothetical protein V6N13_148331 [Hibiscus sabdariffa]
MDALRGRRGRRPTRGRGCGRRADVIQDAPGILDPPPAPIVEDPDEIDEVMVGRVVWRFLQRAGGHTWRPLGLRFRRGC